MKLAQTLDRLMNEINVSAYKISKETGISDRLIGYWRNGDKLPGAENLLTIANYFGISVDYLLNGEDAGLSLSNDEKILLETYRQLSQQGKDYIQQTLFLTKEVYKKPDLSEASIKAV